MRLAADHVTNSIQRQMAMRRFDIVVWNYERVESFLRNFSKIHNYDSARDRITIVSASPSAEEIQRVREFESDHRIEVRYLTRENRGIDQLARAQYLSGTIGSLGANLSHAYIFQMQDHYLDTSG